MNRLTKALVVATSLMTVTALQAQTTEQQAATVNQTSQTTQVMQRYTFTYDFNNTVHPVVKFVKERQQLIQYDLVTEVQQDAYRAINEIGASTLVADNRHLAYGNVLLAK